MGPTRLQWFVPLVTAVVGAIVAWALWPPLQASVLPDSVEPLGDGLVRADIIWWIDPVDAVIYRDSVVVHQEQIEDGLVDVWRVGEEWTTDDPRLDPVSGGYLFGASIGAMFGVVMVMTMRGFGYVRGTGEPGSRPRVPVGEEEGFYWRT